MIGRFNTDTEALKSRAQINAGKAKHDLEEWMIPLLPPLRSLQVLDLGCGTGKQIFRFAPLVAGEGWILGVDVSKNAVCAVNERARAEELRWVEAAQMPLDDCVQRLAGRHFDLIVSSYAIYYSKDIVALLKGVRSLLTDRGTVFVCGPGKHTNREILDIVNRFIPDSSEKLEPIDDFLGPAEIRDIARSYSKSIVSRLENKILFGSPDGVLSWWNHHNSFVPSVAAGVQEYVNAYFENNETFSLTKNVLGVRFDV